VGNQIDWKFVWDQLQQQPNCNNVCLYKIGVHAGILTQIDLQELRGDQLTSEMRKRVLRWLRLNAKEIGLASLNQVDKARNHGTPSVQVKSQKSKIKSEEPHE